jgi:hypothetical protein
MGDSMSTIINATTTNGVVIQPDNSGSLALQTNNGTAAVTIDTSQNVGIGTASPASYNAIANQLVLLKAADTGITIATGTTQTGSIFFADGTTSDAAYRGYVQYVHNTDHLAFGTSGLERMRIDSSGKVGVGMSPTDPLTIQCSSQGFGGGIGMKLQGGANNWGIVIGGDNKLYLGYAASGSLAAVGNFATNGTYTATSDIRKKKDISYTFNGLEIVNALKPAQGRMLEDDDTSPLRPMFIAQDMVDVIPALVSNLEPTPSDDPLLGVDYASIAPILVKAIQEQQTIINDLKARVTVLEAK